MDSGEPSAMGLAKLKARLEALEKSQAREIADLREAIRRLEGWNQPQTASSAVPPPLPPQAPVEEAAPEMAPAPIDVVEEPVAIEASPSTPEGLVVPAVPPAQEKDSVELQIGRVWLVRIGVVLLLTGLVLLGSYAYQNWIRELPAGLRLAALYLGSFGMGFTGWRFARGEKMERFGEVLLAGGMAFFYWCTFAAHQVERLKVVESPVVAGLLLLGAAGAIVGVSIRRRTPLTAMMGLLMASYATTLQPVGWLAALSNVLLSGAGVFLMRRPGWSAVGAVGMAGIYGSYLWWNLMGASGAGADSFGIGFLAATWALFALPGVVGLAGRFEAALSARATAWFVGLNNAACFGLISLQWLMMGWDGYWRVPAVFGGVLLVLGAVSRGRNRGSSTQLSQGLAMLTLALLLKLQGYQLAIGLGIEAVALAGAFWRFRKLPELAFSILAMGGAAVVTFIEPATTTLSSGFVALALALGTGLVRWGQTKVEQGSATQQMAIAGSITGLVAASLVAFFGWIIELDVGWQAGVAAALSLALSVLHLWVGRPQWFPQLREASAGFAIGAVALMGWHLGDASSVAPSMVGLCAAASAFLWEKRSGGEQVAPLAWFHAMVFPVAVGLCLLTWDFGEELSLILLSGAVPGMVLAFRWLDCRSLVLGASSLLLWCLGLTVGLGEHQSVFGFLTVVSAIATLLVAVFRYERRGVDLMMVHGVTRSVATISWIWAWVGLLPNGWVEVIPLTTLAIWIGLRSWKVSGFRPELIALAILSALGFLKSLVTADWDLQGDPVVSHGLGFVVGLGCVVFVPQLRLKPFARLLQALFAGSASLWLTQLGAVFFGWQPMVILWSVLGFAWVAVGLWQRMTTLRHIGFVLLTLSLAKLFVVDVWAFGTFTRVLAFIALGVALVVLGFFYNRFAAVLKRVLSEDETEHPETEQP